MTKMTPRDTDHSLTSYIQEQVDRAYWRDATPKQVSDLISQEARRFYAGTMVSSYAYRSPAEIAAVLPAVDDLQRAIPGDRYAQWTGPERPAVLFIPEEVAEYLEWRAQACDRHSRNPDITGYERDMRLSDGAIYRGEADRVRELEIGDVVAAERFVRRLHHDPPRARRPVNPVRQVIGIVENHLLRHRVPDRPQGPADVERIRRWQWGLRDVRLGAPRRPA